MLLHNDLSTQIFIVRHEVKEKSECGIKFEGHLGNFWFCLRHKETVAQLQCPSPLLH